MDAAKGGGKWMRSAGAGILKSRQAVGARSGARGGDDTFIRDLSSQANRRRSRCSAPFLTLGGALPSSSSSCYNSPFELGNFCFVTTVVR